MKGYEWLLRFLVCILILFKWSRQLTTLAKKNLNNTDDGHQLLQSLTDILRQEYNVYDDHSQTSSLLHCIYQIKLANQHAQRVMVVLYSNTFHIHPEI